MGTARVKKQLSSSHPTTTPSGKKKERYAFESACPGIREKGPKLLGRLIDIATSRTTYMPMSLGEEPTE